MAAGETDQVRREDLLAPRETLPAKLSGLPKGWTPKDIDGGWRIDGPADARSVTLVLKPESGDDWNIAAWNYARMDVRNEGPGLVRIEARLENAQAEDWRNAFAAIERDWFVPLRAALGSKIETLTIVAPSIYGQLSWTLHGKDRWKFWRKSRPMQAMAKELADNPAEGTTP